MSQKTLFDGPDGPVAKRSGYGKGSRVCPTCGFHFKPYNPFEGYEAYCSNKCRLLGQSEQFHETGRDALGRLPTFEPHKLHRTTDPETSTAAAEQAESLREGHFVKILNAMAAFSSGMTSQEIADECGLEHWAVTRRMGELRAAGRVVETDQRRPNRSGRKAIVWNLNREGS